MSNSNTPRVDIASSKRRQGVESLPRNTNLSGIPLKIKESAIELKNFVKQWSKLHITGIAVLNSIKTLKIDSMRSSERELYPQGLQERCDQLQHVLDKMNSCFTNLAVLVQQLKALVELDNLQGGNKGPIHLSWSTGKFGQAYQEIYNAYAKELALKNVIKEEVAHSSKKECLSYYITSWTLQPFISNECKVLLETIFYETDLR